jgi:4-amino-4-deoxy-L-arabinose transferase-like glycosyltransferase
MIQEKIGVQPTAKAMAANALLWRELAILGGMCAFLLFYGLSSFGLVGADEPRYAQIAREMLERHDWIVPVLGGKPWLEKPVLFYWQAMLSYSVFGVSDWAARIPNALNAVAMVLAVYVFVRRFRPGSQLDAALIAVSMAAVIGYGRAASTDMPLAASFAIAMLAWLTWHATQEKKWLALFYVLIGLGTLAKGPVAPFLAALVIIPFAAIRRNLRIVLRTLWAPGILLFLAIALPWYVGVQVRVPEFFRVFILEHNLARYGSNLYHHNQPFWYYVPVVLIALLPWTVLAITGLVDAIRTQGKTASESDSRRREFSLFFALWSVLPVLFFSFSGSKLPGYILPAVPAFVLLIVEWLDRKRTEGGRVSPMLIIGHSAVATMVLLVALLCHYIIYRVRPTAPAYEVAGAFSAVVFAVCAGMLLLRGLRVLRLVTLIPVLIGIAFVLKVASPAIDATQSARPVAREIQSVNKDVLPVAGFGIRRELEYGLNFYLDQPIPMYERAEIPAGTHIVVARQGSETALAALVSGRRITRLRAFDPQNLEIYIVESRN